MKILIAPDSYKNCLTARQVAQNIGAGIQRIIPDAAIRDLPVADGGEGTVQALVDATGGEIITTVVFDPLMREVESFYGILGDGKTAVIEMAAASGLELIDETERNPALTTTYGTGQLIKKALDNGVEHIIIGIGGSATNDGGAGMVEALGGNFRNQQGELLDKGGLELKDLHSMDLSAFDQRVAETKFTVACDVDNPLTGINGASQIYGPQKGALKELVGQLDEALKNFAALIRENLGKDVEFVPGAGAAGGLGAGLMAFCNAELKPGFQIVREKVHLDEAVQWADIVITGEGKMDHQTPFGKTPHGVAQTAKKYAKPVIGIAGTLGEGYEALYEQGFDALLSITDKPMRLEDAMRDAGQLLQDTAANMMRLVVLGAKTLDWRKE
ncbi:MAG: glycerate kinase [Bacteroidales bacterium]|nr:glycerate kinase [Bacteroidales bacterium]